MQFLLEELRDQEIIRNRRKLTLNIYQNLNKEHRRDCCNVSFLMLFFRLYKVHCFWYYVTNIFLLLKIKKFNIFRLLVKGTQSRNTLQNSIMLLIMITMNKYSNTII